MERSLRNAAKAGHAKDGARTFSEKRSVKCTLCDTARNLLTKAGVSVTEWHAFLNKTFTFPDR